MLLLTPPLPALKLLVCASVRARSLLCVSRARISVNSVREDEVSKQRGKALRHERRNPRSKSIISLSSHLFDADSRTKGRIEENPACVYIIMCIHRSVVQARSRGGRWYPRSSLHSFLTVSVDVKQHWTMLRHWSQFVPNMSTDIRGHEAPLHHRSVVRGQELCESRGGRPGLPSLISLMMM